MLCVTTACVSIYHMEKILMRQVALLVVAGVIASLAGGGVSAQSTDQLAQQVREAERAFAGSMAKRDFAAFGALVADDAVFFGGRGAQRGKAAVLAGWKGFFDQPQAPFSWEPETVEVLSSGTLGLSSGPVKDPNGKQTGVFNSIWRREADGRWRVVFDKGCQVCDCPSGP
jgi:ketosteroid isomerase-like protein